jgi:hypothetical protein
MLGQRQRGSGAAPTTIAFRRDVRDETIASSDSAKVPFSAIRNKATMISTNTWLPRQGTGCRSSPQQKRRFDCGGGSSQHRGY